MSLSQNRPVVPPSRNDGGLLDFSQIVQKSLEVLFQAGHTHKIVTAPPAANDGSIGDIYIVYTMADTYLTIKTATGWVSQGSSSTSLDPTVYIGARIPKNFTCTATTGGSLASGTYIYKIYPYTSTNFVGTGSPETTIVVAGANHTVTMTWTASEGASYYKIQRSTVSGSYDGWFRVNSGTSFTDSGQAFTGAPPIIVPSEQLDISMGGGLQLPAGIGSIQWLNYATGNIGGFIGCTSAGEMNIGTGDGFYPGRFYFSKTETSPLLFTIDVSQSNTPGPAILFGDGSANYEGYINGIKLHFYANGNEKMLLDSTTLTIDVLPKFAGTNATGSVTATLGSNGPSMTTTPYTWIKAVSSDGSEGYIPFFKKV